LTFFFYRTFTISHFPTFEFIHRGTRGKRGRNNLFAYPDHPWSDLFLKEKILTAKGAKKRERRNQFFLYYISFSLFVAPSFFIAEHAESAEEISCLRTQTIPGLI
jgi:hypothetical protein